MYTIATNEQRLAQEECRISEMSAQEAREEHQANADDWISRTVKPSVEEALYRCRLQDMLYSRSLGRLAA